MSPFATLQHFDQAANCGQASVHPNPDESEAGGNIVDYRHVIHALRALKCVTQRLSFIKGPRLNCCDSDGGPRVRIHLPPAESPCKP
jgi:hypothetical protein